MIYPPEHVFEEQNTTLFVTPIDRKSLLNHRLEAYRGKILYIDDFL